VRLVPGPAPGFIAASNQQPRRKSRAQEVAGGVPVGRRQSGFAGRSEGLDDRAAEYQLVVGIGDHQVAAGPQHPGEFGHHRLQCRHVGQPETGDDEIHRIGGQGKPVQIAERKLTLRHPHAGSIEHVE
jgi:hypothetical protein